MKTGWFGILTTLAVAASFRLAPHRALAQAQNLMDPSLTELGYVPLPDLGLGTYTRDGHTELGGLYPGGRPVRPPEFEAAVLEIAKNQIQPLDAQGNPDPVNGRIVLMSAGMSNTNIFFEGRPDLPHTAFHKRAQNDPARNPQLVIVNGAQGTRAAMDWEAVDSTTYSTMKNLLAKAKVTPAQVQVVWVLHALRETGPFPAYAQELPRYLEATARNLKIHFPNGGPGGEPFHMNPNPVKTFCNPGLYTAYLTVTDNDGNAVTREVAIKVTGVAPTPATFGASRKRSPNRSRPR